MIRSIIGAVLGAAVFVQSAIAEPTQEQWREAARWSAQMQEALQVMISGLSQVDGFVRAMEDVGSGAIGPEEGRTQVAEVTLTMQRGVDDYKAILLAMPPHPLPDERMGKAAVDVHQQLVDQSQLLAEFIGRIGELSLQAIGGDEDATNALLGELFRSSVYIIGTDVAMLRTQVGALDEFSPLRSLNLAQIAELEYSQEIILYRAATLYGAVPDAHNGDLDLAAARLVTAREEISNGRKNAVAMRSGLLIEKARLGSTDPLYDDLIAMMDTFEADWTTFDAALAEAGALLSLMRSDDPAAEEAFNDYLDTSASLSQSLMTSQLNRSKVVGN